MLYRPLIGLSVGLSVGLTVGPEWTQPVGGGGAGVSQGKG